jgi:hypothetical protein
MMTAYLKWVYLVGPVLYLAAQLVIPATTQEAVTRSSIIRAEAGSWQSGHQLLIVAFVFLLLTLIGLAERARPGGRISTDLGLILAGAGLLGAVAITVIQLVVVATIAEASLPTQLLVTQVLKSVPLASITTVPVALLVPGMLVIALPLFRAEKSWYLPVAVVLTGVLLVAGVLLASKLLLVLGAAVMTGATVLALVRPARPSVA